MKNWTNNGTQKRHPLNRAHAFLVWSGVEWRVLRCKRAPMMPRKACTDRGRGWNAIEKIGEGIQGLFRPCHTPFVSTPFHTLLQGVVCLLTELNPFEEWMRSTPNNDARHCKLWQIDSENDHQKEKPDTGVATDEASTTATECANGRKIQMGVEGPGARVSSVAIQLKVESH